MENIEFKHKITQETLGTYAGSALEETLLGDPNWYPVGEVPDGTASGPAAATGAPATLGDLTAKELKALAAERGIELGKATKKADIIELIEKGPGNPTPNPADLVADLTTLSDEQLDEVVDLVDDLDVDERADREIVLKAIREHANQDDVTTAIQTVTAE